jgi:hypothetical protein
MKSVIWLMAANDDTPITPIYIVFDCIHRLRLLLLLYLFPYSTYNVTQFKKTTICFSFTLKNMSMIQNHVSIVIKQLGKILYLVSHSLISMYDDGYFVATAVASSLSPIIRLFCKFVYHAHSSNLCCHPRSANASRMSLCSFSYLSPWWPKTN